ncbi:hypothetical protein ASC94_26860 [Massilia sp. Root418]|jgi:hypothetical protein|nr:hypothetical protein ASC94_26860 [Massilia sp. Root418]
MRLNKIDIPVLPRQLFYLAVTLIAPLVLTISLVILPPLKAGQGTDSRWVALGIAAAILTALTGVLFASAKRHEVELSEQLLVIRHSLYTLVVQRGAVKLATVRQVTSTDALELTSRKNGIALFGYLSGWFWSSNGALTFCAVSAMPAHVITFEGDAKCRKLILSASPETVQDILRWCAARPE